MLHIASDDNWIWPTYSLIYVHKFDSKMYKETHENEMPTGYFVGHIGKTHNQIDQQM